MVTVTGFALRRKADRVTEQITTPEGQKIVKRVYFPLRVPDDNRAMLVSLPFEAFDPRITLYDTADRQMSFSGVVERTPTTTSGQRIEQLFTDVTFPSQYSLSVGAEGGTRIPRVVAACGIALAVLGSALVALRRTRRVVLPSAETEQESATVDEDSRPPLASLGDPGPRDVDGGAVDAAGQPRAGDNERADAFTAMTAIVSGRVGEEGAEGSEDVASAEDGECETNQESEGERDTDGT
jgi:hypothetical protein